MIKERKQAKKANSRNTTWIRPEKWERKIKKITSASLSQVEDGAAMISDKIKAKETDGIVKVVPTEWKRHKDLFMAQPYKCDTPHDKNKENTTAKKMAKLRDRQGGRKQAWE